MQHTTTLRDPRPPSCCKRKTKKKKNKKKRLKAAKGASLSRHSLREGGRAVEVRKGVGCGQREEQAPVTEQEMAG